MMSSPKDVCAHVSIKQPTPELMAPPQGGARRAPAPVCFHRVPQQDQALRLCAADSNTARHPFRPVSIFKSDTPASCTPCFCRIKLKTREHQWGWGWGRRFPWKHHTTALICVSFVQHWVWKAWASVVRENPTQPRSAAGRLLGCAPWGRVRKSHVLREAGSRVLGAPYLDARGLS